MARVGSRVLALLVDGVLQLLLTVLLVVAGFAVSVGRSLSDALVEAMVTGCVVVVFVGYPVLFETLNDGRTPGKLAVGLRVVRDDGGPVSARQALTRALVGVAVEWPGLVLPLVTWVASAATTLADHRGRRLGDLAAGTMVVHERTPAAGAPVPGVPPRLAGWARTLDLTRVDDALALAVRQLLGRGPQISAPAGERLAAALWAEVLTVVSPAPPPGTPPWLGLGAVLAERNARAAHRLASTRAVTAALWPELTPVTGAPPAVRQAAPVPAQRTGPGATDSPPSSVR